MEDREQLGQSNGLKDLTIWQKLLDVLTVIAILGVVAWVAAPFGMTHVDRRVPLGKVDAIHYFGVALSTMTQLDTRIPGPPASTSNQSGDSEYRSLVLHGTSQFRKGQEVILDFRRFGAMVCDVTVSYCEDVKGDPL